MIYNQYELTADNSCITRRSKKISLNKNTDSSVIERSVLVKKCILEILQGRMTLADMDKEVDNFFSTTQDNLPTQTKNMLASDIKACIKRYIKSEIALKRNINFFPSCEIKLDDDIEMNTRPDMVVVHNGGIELIQFHFGRPLFTANGSKDMNSLSRYIPAYAMLRYGRLFVKPGKKAIITFSMYYLRKDNDSAKNNIFESDYFNGKGRCIVSISELYENNGKENESDAALKDLLSTFKKGREITCNKEFCESCTFYKICNYKAAPIKVEEVKENKKTTDIHLTDCQKAAVNAYKGIFRINAGAGAGKTLTVALRVIELLKRGVNPKSILLMTFTNTGAEEMRTRIDFYNKMYGTGQDISEMRIKTFNAFQDEIVHENWELLGFDNEPRLIDDVERSSIIMDILRNTNIVDLDYRNFFANNKNVQGALIVARKIFAIMKSYMLGDSDDDVEKIQEKLGWQGKFLSKTCIRDTAKLYDEFCQRLNDESLIEFTDQEILTFQIIYNCPDYFDKMDIKHVIIDEFQDSNEGQMDFVKCIIDTKNFESLMVVGDDSQAIFSFRDTSPKFIIDFWNYLGRQGQDFYLLENHRSTEEVIDFANKLNALNKHRVIKDLKSTRGNGKPVVCRGFCHKDLEYNYIVDQIKKKVEAGEKYEDIAVIAFSKPELLKMASILTENGIPSVLLNPEPLMENSRVLAALDMLRFVGNTNASEAQLSWLNCLYKNELFKLGDNQIKDLMDRSRMEVEALRNMPEKMKLNKLYEMLDAMNVEDDEVFASFIDTLKLRKSTESLLKYASDFELFGADCAFKRSSNYPGVVLTTAHSSKGMEWKIVFNTISGYDKPENRNNQEIQEEKRRLFFVSATRARDELYITGQYIAYGDKKHQEYNMYLKDAYNILGLDYRPDLAFLDYSLQKAKEKAEKLEKEKAELNKKANRKTNIA